MSLAYRCEVCDRAPCWRIERTGDAVVAWACSLHLHKACLGLQRLFDWPTRLIVTEFNEETL